MAAPPAAGGEMRAVLVGEPSQERLALEPQHAPEACRRHRGVVLGPPENGSFIDLEQLGDLAGGEEYRQSAGAAARLVVSYGSRTPRTYR